MTRWKVFFTEPIDGYERMVETMEKGGCTVSLGPHTREATREISEEELIRRAADLDAIMVGTRERVTRKVLEAGTRLRTVAKYAIGVERIDVKAATELRILVSNTPVDENFVGVAEGTVARILALAKNLKRCDYNARRRIWKDIVNVLVCGKTVGIVGFGNIGSRVAEFLAPFGVRLLAFDPYADPERAVPLRVELTDLETLLRESDFVTLHCVTTPETRGIMNEARFRLMKPGAFLINTARGALINEKDLHKALREGWIAGAALDSYDPEPPALDNPLLSAELEFNTQLSPHAAGATAEGTRRMSEAQVENCLRALRGEIPEFVVNPPVIPSWRRRWQESG